MLNELENLCNSLLPLTTSMPCQFKGKKYEKTGLFLITTRNIKVAKCQKIYCTVRAQKNIQATAYKLQCTQAYLLMFIIIQRVSALWGFWDLKKTGLCKIRSSGTVKGLLLTPNSPSYT